MKKLINWILSLFKTNKETIETKENKTTKSFVLKAEFTVKNGKLIRFLYSTNKGKNWKPIMSYESPFLNSNDYDYVWTELVVPFYNLDYQFWSEKFSTYNKIVAYELEKKKEFETKFQAHKDRREQILRTEKEKLNKLNEKLNSNN